MPRALEDLLDGPGLDDAAAIHDGDTVGDLGDDAEIVRDEDHGRARLGLAPGEHGKHLRLHGDVEGGRRFVGDDESRTPAIAMAITARWRMPPENWCGYCPARPCRIGDVDLAQELDGALARLRAGETSVGDLALGDLPPDRQDRVQGRGRILEDEADVLPRAGAAAFRRRRRDLLPVRAGSSRERARSPAAGRRSRATVTLLPDPDSPTIPSTSFGIDVEVDAAHGRNRATRSDEGDLQPPDGQDRFADRGIRGRRGTVRLHQGLNPIVRATSMLSMSSVKPSTFFAATIRPVS